MREELVLSIQDLPAPRAEVFAFFSDPSNLERLTPPWLNFRIVTPAPLPKGEGALFEYRLKVRGLPIFWRTLIERWDEGHCFVDRQLIGPYALWHHTHLFEDLPDGGTRITDRVRYRVGFGIIGRIATWLMVRRDIQNVFEYRKAIIAEVFAKRGRVA